MHPSKTHPETQSSNPKLDGGEATRPAQRNIGKYALGAVLAYGCCVLLGGRMMASDFWVAVQLGLIMGLCLYVFAGPVHFLLQYVGCQFIHGLRVGAHRELLLVNSPVLILFLCLLVRAALPLDKSTVRQAFVSHFEHTVPDSVEITGYRYLRGLNEGSYLMAFRVSTQDLEELLATSGFKLDKPALDEGDMAEYRKTLAKLGWSRAFEFRAPGTLYALTTNTPTSRTDKRVIVDASRTEVLFSESFY